MYFVEQIKIYLIQIQLSYVHVGKYDNIVLSKGYASFGSNSVSISSIVFRLTNKKLTCSTV